MVCKFFKQQLDDFCHRRNQHFKYKCVACWVKRKTATSGDFTVVERVPSRSLHQKNARTTFVACHHETLLAFLVIVRSQNRELNSNNVKSSNIPSWQTHVLNLNCFSLLGQCGLLLSFVFTSHPQRAATSVRVSECSELEMSVWSKLANAFWHIRTLNTKRFRL